jgi:uncharacterized protein (DUF1697 family)
MNRYVALLRGINVGGKHLLPMKSLVEIFELNGCKNVRTYIQSGNVVFDCDGADVTALQTAIQSGIEATFAFKPDVLMIPKNEFLQALTENPFPTDNGRILHISFLAETPVKVDRQQLDALKAASEAWHLAGKFFYLYAPEGIGRSKLAAKAEARLGVSATARNWNTVRKLAEMLAEPQ